MKISGKSPQTRGHLIFKKTIASVILFTFVSSISNFPDAVADTATTNTSPTVPMFSTANSQGFQMSQNTQVSGIFTSCNQGQNMAINSAKSALDLITSSGSGLSKTNTAVSTIGVSINTICPTTDDGVTDTLSCSNIAQLSSYKARDDKALTGLKCQSAKIKAVQGELQCLSASASALSQKIGSISDLYSKNIATMNTAVQAADAAIKDRTDQLDNINDRLNGGKAGETGLMQMQAILKGGPGGNGGMIAQMPMQVQSIKTAQLASATQRTQLDEWIKAKEMAMASQCFQTQTNPLYKCDPNGPPVSAQDLVACRARQYTKLGTGNQIERDKLHTIRGNQAQDTAAGVLANMLSNMPSTTTIPTTQQELSASMGSSMLIKTPADIDAQFGAQLAGLDVKGLDMKGFVETAFAVCYNTALTKVSADRQSSSSDIGINIKRITDTEKQTQIAASAQVSAYAQTYADATKALTGVNAPLQTAGCDTGTPAVQAKCLDDVSLKLTNLSKGVGPAAQFNETIVGDNPATNIAFQCSGIDGCVAAFQNANRNVILAKKNIETSKTSYINTSNANITAFTKQLQQQLSPESKNLTDQEKALSAALASVGGTPLKIGTVHGEDLTKGENGIYQDPKNILGLVGAKLNPPMLDVSGDAFGTASTSIGDANKKTDAKIAKIQADESTWATTAAACRSDKFAAYQEKVNDFLSQCEANQKNCASKTSLDDLMAGISKALAKEGVTLPDSNGSSLSAGYDCSDYKLASTDDSSGRVNTDDADKTVVDVLVVDSDYCKNSDATKPSARDNSAIADATALVPDGVTVTAQSRTAAIKSANDQLQRDIDQCSADKKSAKKDADKATASCQAVYKKALKDGQLLSSSVNSDLRSGAGSAK